MNYRRYFHGEIIGALLEKHGAVGAGLDGEGEEEMFSR
jgi:hypothetical protein